MADIIFPGEAPADTLGTTRLPSNVDLAFWQGDSQRYVLELKDSNGAPIDLANAEPSAVIRASFNSPDTYSFTCTIADGKVNLYLPSTVSKTIPAGDYIWNFQIKTTTTGDVRTYLAGDVTVYAEVDD